MSVENNYLNNFHTKRINFSDFHEIYSKSAMTINIILSFLVNNAVTKPLKNTNIHLRV